MEVFIKIVQFVLSISLLVIIHELGHFMWAKLFKCRVEKFYLFFDAGFSIFKKKIGETEYGIGWLPLGGYVKISGMIDESMDKEQMKLPAKDWEFRAKPSWQRLLIMIGGVVNNFILAFVIYIATMAVWGNSYIPIDSLEHGIAINSTEIETGLKNGDRIIEIGGKEVIEFNSLTSMIALEGAESIKLVRSGDTITIPISTNTIKAITDSKTPFFSIRTLFSSRKIVEFSAESIVRDSGLQLNDIVLAIDSKEFKFNDQFESYIRSSAGKDVVLAIERDGQKETVSLKVPASGILGMITTPTVTPNIDIVSEGISLGEAIPRGIETGVNEINKYITQVKLMFNPELKLYKKIGGFYTIGSIFPSSWNWESFWRLTALLSIMLGVLNILPIPALDGGHVMFLLYEIITRRKPNEKFMEYAQVAGMILLFALLIFANGNDIIRNIF